MKRQKKRKAMITLSFVIAIIVAAIVAIFLWQFLTSLFTVKDSEIKQAQQSMRLIQDGLERAKLNGESTVLVLFPSNWVISSWPIQDGFQKPDVCLNTQYCICLCPIPSKWSQVTDSQMIAGLIEKCNSYSNCTTVKSPIIVMSRQLTLMQSATDYTRTGAGYAKDTLGKVIPLYDQAKSLTGVDPLNIPLELSDKLIGEEKDIVDQELPIKIQNPPVELKITYTSEDGYEVRETG